MVIDIPLVTKCEKGCDRERKNCETARLKSVCACDERNNTLYKHMHTIHKLHRKVNKLTD